MGKPRKPKLVSVSKARLLKVCTTTSPLLSSATRPAIMAGVSSPRAASTQSSNKSSTSSLASKRLKNVPPSPDRLSPLISMEVLLEEIRAIRPVVEETNNRMQSLEKRWLSLEGRMSTVEQQVSVVQGDSQQITSLEKEVRNLQRHTEDLENRNRRNNLRIYGLPESLEGEDPVSFFSSFLPKLLDMPSSTSLCIQRAHRLGPRPSLSASPSRPRGVILLFLKFTDLLAVLRTEPNVSFLDKVIEFFFPRMSQMLQLHDGRSS